MKNLIIVVSILAFVARTSSQNYTLCPGASATLSAPSPTNLANPSYSLNPGGISSTNGQFVVTPTASATYTLYTTGTNSNSALVTYSAIASVTHPTVTFNLVSNQNFTLGCFSKSVTTVSSTVQVSPQLFSFTYSFVPPGGSTVLPTGSLAASSSHSINSPGTWTLITRYHPGECDVRFPFSVMTNTAVPTIDSVVVPTQTLSCQTPSVLLEGYNNNPNAGVQWFFPGIPTLPGNTVSVYINSSQPTSTTIAAYTLVIIDYNNGCSTTSVVPMYQNLFPPKAMISTGGNATITCSQPTIMLTNQSSTGIPPNSTFPTNQPVMAWLWQIPSPFLPPSASNSLVAQNPGVYTLTVKDLNNGCTSKTTITVYDKRIYPVVQSPGDYNICGGINSVTLSPIVVSNSTALTFSWSAPPNATASGPNSLLLVTNTAGIYTLTARNPEGCETYVLFNVVYCLGLEEATLAKVTVFPNPASGYLNVSGILDVNAQLILYDQCLREVRRTAATEKICISDLDPGVYGLMIEASGERRLVWVVRE